MKTVFIPCQSVCLVVNGRLSGLFCRWHGGRLPETRPAQLDSGISKLEMGLMGVIGIMGIMRRRHKSKNDPAQRDFGISILKTSPTGLLTVRLVPQSGDPYRSSVFKNRPAQRDSGISKLGTVEQGIITVPVKNLEGYFMSGWRNESMSKMQNSLPQRHSKMSNGRLSGCYAGRMGRKESLLCR